MPRAYCPQCGSEVPVDDDGVCHVGHHVDLDAAAGDPAGAPAPSPEDPDEVQPWVASVDATTLGGFTPPPGEAAGTADDAGDETDDTRTDGSTDDLADAAAAAAASVQDDEAPGPDPVEASGEQVEAGWPETLPSEGDAPGWTPPTNDPVTPPPVPPPAPADPPAPAPETDDAGPSGDDFDLDDLAAAVSDLHMDDAAPEPATEPAAGADPAAAGPTPPPAENGWEDELGEPGGPAGSDASERSAGDAAPVDLGNFTAKSGKVKTDDGGRKGGLFRKR